MAERAQASGRDWYRGSLEVLVLSVLIDGPTHGYAVRQKIESATGQPLAVGTLYPLLHRLEAGGLIRAERTTVAGRERKTYRPTDAGRSHFRALATDWHAAFARMQAVVLPALRRGGRGVRPL